MSLIKNLIVAVAVSIASSTHAGILGNIIPGIALINQSADITMKSPVGNSSTSDDGSGLGISFDLYHNRLVRFNVTGSYVGYDLFDVAKISVSADYLFPIDNRIALFGGISTGGVLQKYSDAGLTDSAVSIEYGAQLGVIGSINNRLMLESGYRYRPTDITTDVATAPGTSFNVESLDELYISILMIF